MDLVFAAALKHAYLAACLHQLEVPGADSVHAIRRVLLAARDRDRPALADALTKIPDVLGIAWIEAPDAPSVLLMETSDDQHRWLIALGGRLLLPWPFPEVRPRAEVLQAQPHASTADPEPTTQDSRC